jgi:integrase/recombinase XerC
MARPNKLWFRTARNAWFVTINGKKHNLGPDEQEAKRKFHELMAASVSESPVETSSKSHVLTVADIFEKFLDWCSKHRSPGTYEWSRYRVQMFIDALGKDVLMASDALRPFHLQEWIDKHEWSANYRRGIIAAVQRAYNWALRIGHLTANPIRFIEKPSATRREQVITPEEWPAIRDHYEEGDPFRDLLEFAWETGIRPEEVKKIEARHLQLASHRVVFPKQEAKGKRRPRVIFMTHRAEAIIIRLVQTRPEGLLFRNADGVAWTSYAINCRFCRLKKTLGTKYAAYSLRHGFATRKLEEGVDHLTVAAWMGHADATMLARVYSHVGERDTYLHEKLNGKPSANMDVPKN